LPSSGALFLLHAACQKCEGGPAGCGFHGNWLWEKEL